MSVNTYWPIYKSIENEFVSLMNYIFVDDNQLQVYSIKNIDLILRTATEIESLSKELYHLNGGKKTGNIPFDHIALKYLNNLWTLDKKIVIIGSPICFLSNTILTPFKKYIDPIDNRLKYIWNIAYQALKHDRANSLQLGTLNILFQITSALYLLNLYYMDNKFDLGKDNTASSLNLSFGSSIYSVKLHKNTAYTMEAEFIKNVDYDECTYLQTWSDKFQIIAKELLDKFNQIYQAKIIKEINEKTSQIKTLKDESEQIKQIKQIEQNLSSIQRGIFDEQKSLLNPFVQQMEYEAVLNKNQFNE